MEYLCRTHTDDRGFRIFDLFPQMTNEGQINIQYFFDPKIVTAFHGHKHEEWFTCIRGSFKFALVEQRELNPEEKQKICTLNGVTIPQNGHTVRWDYLSDKNPNRVIKVSSNQWHGFRCLEPGSILLYYISEKYNIEHIKREPITKFCKIEDWFNNGE